MGRRVLRRGSKKGHSRRHLEGRSTPFREYDAVGMCPKLRKQEGPRKGNRGPVGGTDDPGRGTEGPVSGTGPLLIVRNHSCTHSSYGYTCWGSHGSLRKAQFSCFGRSLDISVKTSQIRMSEKGG